MDPDRKRKLLLHRSQITYLDAKLRQKGLALIPLELLFDTHNRVKLVIGLARGKKLYDKRADAARRDSERFSELLRSGVVSRCCSSRRCGSMFTRGFVGL